MSGINEKKQAGAQQTVPTSTPHLTGSYIEGTVSDAEISQMSKLKNNKTNNALDKLKGASIAKNMNQPKESFRGLDLHNQGKGGEYDDDDDDESGTNRAKVHHSPDSADGRPVKAKPPPKSCCTIS